MREVARRKVSENADLETLTIPLFFQKKFSLFSGLFPVFFRPYSGKTPGKKRKHFPEKERNLLNFKVRPADHHVLFRFARRKPCPGKILLRY